MADKPCHYCGVRLILAISTTGRKLPPVNAGPDPLGTVGIVHEATGTHRGRFLTAGDVLGPVEKRHAVHECDGTRHAAQRDQLRAAQSAHAAGLRRGRTRPAAPGVLPGGRIYPGGRP